MAGDKDARLYNIAHTVLESARKYYAGQPLKTAEKPKKQKKTCNSSESE